MGFDVQSYSSYSCSVRATLLKAEINHLVKLAAPRGWCRHYAKRCNEQAAPCVAVRMVTQQSQHDEMFHTATKQGVFLLSPRIW